MNTLKNESTQLIQMKEKEFQKTQKRYERSLGDIKSCYEKSSKQVNENLNELELMAQEMKQSRAKLSLKREIYMRTVEQEISNNQDDLITQSGRINLKNLNTDNANSYNQRTQSIDQLEQTSKYSIIYTNRNQGQDQNMQSIDNEVKASARGGYSQVNNSFLEKTTPRSSRPSFIEPKQSNKPQAMIKNYASVPKNNSKSKSKHQKHKEKSFDVMNSIDLSNIVKKESEQSTNLKKNFGESNKKVDESVYAPAFILGERDPEWDSFLDDTKVHLFRQVYALQNKVDPSILKSPKRIDQCSTPKNRKQNEKSKNNNYQANSLSKSTKKQGSLQKTSDERENNKQTYKIYSNFQSNHKTHQNRLRDSSNKKYKFTDVKLQEMLDVSNAFTTHSPLPSLPTDEKQYPNKQSCQKEFMDVQLEDLMNVKSLSISLRTATDAGAFLNEDNNNSFLRSDNKKSNFKFNSNIQKTHQINQTSMYYQEDDSMIQDKDNQQQYTIEKKDRNYIRNINKEVFNIIDEHNNNGELTGNILEESDSSYSKTGQINFQGTQQTLESQFSREHLRSDSANEYEEYKMSSIHEDDKINSISKNKNSDLPDSFKSTAVMAALGENKQCLDNISFSCNQSQIPTPAFNYRQKSSQNEYLDQSERSLSNNDLIPRRKGNYLLQNHLKLIEKVTEKQEFSNQNFITNNNYNDATDLSSNFNTLNTQSSQKELLSNNSQSFISQKQIQNNNSKPQLIHFVPRSSSANTNCKIQKLKLNIVKKAANPSQLQQDQNSNRTTNQSMITIIEKKSLKIVPIRQLQQPDRSINSSVIYSIPQKNGLLSVQNKRANNISSLV
ncbi:UNKNOWN [Stylonychia lemnae]|uniref:Uncharacterized protein n=1 Tax=Stylonychia lemnae TaxID=5949 RepID=A0A077ZQS1_STYLE|nr:UNKNOWN [Stylonychia lemnae]|eukprot:CDW71730.1 UNKNOWN [Stylonychia lemnae]